MGSGVQQSCQVLRVKVSAVIAEFSFRWWELAMPEAEAGASGLIRSARRCMSTSGRGEINSGGQGSRGGLC